ncbi:DUF892 family protein [Flammeovirgaceae bacterium SG7u.111]|nr:DUF892 family protein [Flammeovirgaceae bacterium SG7u.132]WPO36909.1 DUF892 family protein [Flammeovirgaceae bacterium SG7u.111]
MEPINNLKELLKEMLKSCYDSELLQLEAFPKLIDKAYSPELKKAIQSSYEHSKRHLDKMEEIFIRMKVSPVGEVCESTVGQLNETWRLMERIQEPGVQDAAIVTLVQHIHHHDIAGYGTMSAFANAVGYYETSEALHQMLEEEKEMDEELTKMAIQKLNKRAKLEKEEEFSAM